jgi:predicted AAA+ superfamily ATPase
MLKDLTIFRSLSADPVIQPLLQNNKAEALSNLIRFAEEKGISGDVFAYYLFYSMVNDDNIFSRTAELNGGCGTSLCRYAKSDIHIILQFLEKNHDLVLAYTPTCPIVQSPYCISIDNIKKSASKGTEQVFLALFLHYQIFGRGLAAQYIALTWHDELLGIENFDNIVFGDLIGIESQKETLIKNTERLLQGSPANNVLLFGDSGTGKSSCVKALINHYHSRGLRLLELRKSQLSDIDAILEVLEKSKYKYIIFLDDLSFEEGELGYKALKAVLEGKAAKIPHNVVFYATSNRKHLVRELWADRAVEDEEVHISDTMHEKLSLSERFGIRLSFVLPSQAQYLQIVAEIGKKYNLRYDKETEIDAIRWAMFYNGFSGRTAKQFVISKCST